MLYPSESAEARYRLLSSEMQEQQELVSTHRQYRKGVQKDLYSMKNGERLKATLTCPLSEITLTNVNGDAEVVENLKKFHGAMQENMTRKEDDWIQTVRHFHAVSGQFSYQRQQLIADRVYMSRHQIPGTTLVENEPDIETGMKGVARRADLHFGRGFQFRAQNLKATIYAPKGVE